MNTVGPKLTPPLKWHGGKHDLASWVIGLMPPRCRNPNKPADDDPGYLHYVEPYAGGLAVLLANDPEGISEVVNDLNGQLMNFWSVLRCEVLFPAFLRRAEATPFAAEVFDACLKTATELRDMGPAEFKSWVEAATSDHRVKSAWAFFVACRQSMAGRMRNFPPFVRTRTRRGMQDHVSAWLSCIEGLPTVHARMKRVAMVRHADALRVIGEHDGQRTLFYLDPPYLHETRATAGEYQHEMAFDDHRQLLKLLANIKGRFLLSGYRSSLYDMAATKQGWTRHEKRINNHAAGGKTKRIMTECVWCNY